MKLNADHLYTLGKAAEHRRSAAGMYEMDADTQREAWQMEIKFARDQGDYQLTQDEWLVDVVTMIDSIQPDAPIYLLSDDIDLEVDVSWHEGPIDKTPRIVVWRGLIAFFGHGSCLVYFSGTTKYMRSVGTLHVWPSVALQMLAVSQRPAKPRPVGTNERHALAKAKYRPRRDFYYVPNVKYEAPIFKSEPKGGKHASPVAHDRAAHKALLTRVSVEAAEAEDLKSRGYTLAWSEDLPSEVIAGMVRRGKVPTPGSLNAYQWIDKRASRVNASGEQAQRVTLIR